MKTVSKVVAGMGGLIALYLVVYNGTNAGKLLTAGANGTATVAKTLQGRD